MGYRLEWRLLGRGNRLLDAGGRVRYLACCAPPLLEGEFAKAEEVRMSDEATGAPTADNPGEDNVSCSYP
jgi:hypothetical protein